MISKVYSPVGLRKLFLLVSMLAMTVSLAQAQSDDTPTFLPKQPGVTLVDPEMSAEIKLEKNAEKKDGSDVDAAVPEPEYAKNNTKPVGPFTASGTIATSENPFSKKVFEKPVSPARQASGSSGWQVAFAPYLYMTGVSGTVGARGVTTDIDMSFSDVIEDLNLGIMGALEARKGRLVITNDLIWIKLGEEFETPGGLFSSVKVGINMFIWDPEIGYRLYESEAGAFDILGGVRVMSIENNVNFRAGLLPAIDVSERKTWGTPVIGGHGTLNLSPKFFLATKFDIGGGIGADFTGQFYGGAGYRITPKIALIGGYRYMRTDYDSEAGFIFDTSMNGILMGAKFQF